jgi:hypothetical protein
MYSFQGAKAEKTEKLSELIVVVLLELMPIKRELERTAFDHVWI